MPALLRGKSDMGKGIRTLLRLAQVAALVLAAPSAQAIPAPKGSAVAPMGFQLFCLKSPGFCQPGGAEEVAMTPELLKLLREVNLSVNAAIRPRADGRIDTWTLNARAGDCEDYVLAKRMELIEQGLPPSALRIAQVRTRKGAGHAVLVVNTDQGDVVLDNLSTRIGKLPSTGYRLVAMSSADPLVWN